MVSRGWITHNKVPLIFALCLMTRNDSYQVEANDKRYHFGDTLAMSGQVTIDSGQVTTDRQFPTCSRAGRRDGSDGTVRAINFETH